MSTLSDSEIKLEKDVKFLSPEELKVWICNDCYSSKYSTTPPSWYFHDTGKCTSCNSITDISNPSINEIILEKGDWKNEDYGLLIRKYKPSFK